MSTLPVSPSTGPATVAPGAVAPVQRSPHSPRILTRDVPPDQVFALEQAGLSPLLARLLAARGVVSAHELDADLKHLLPPDGLLGIQAAATLLADALTESASWPITTATAPPPAR
jgi:hypothetical protein